MLTVYDVKANALVRREEGTGIAPQSVWIDLHNPTREEETEVEKYLGLDLPTREEMQEIELTSRLYQEDGAHFMTASLLIGIDEPRPVTAAVTFILTPERLVTIRYAEPRSFQMFLSRASRGQLECNAPQAVLIGILELIIDRLADLVERIQGEIDGIVQSIFVDGASGSKQRKTSNFDEVLRTIGREGDLTSRVRDSLLSLDRLLTYFANVAQQRKEDKALRDRIKASSRDVASLSDHVIYQSNQITFLLDATLGMINIEQNAIIKFFSVVAVVFLPPTLIASIYGMNFEHMPELSWPWGYPLAIVLMVASAVLPVWIFRRRGWL
jgi:magnesium transporter